MIFWVFIAVGVAAKTTDVTIKGLGTARGLELENGVRVFKGLRYAYPPVGDFRWMAPFTPQPWSGIYDATDFGASCLQPPHFSPPITNMSEDCLFLNVYAPPVSSGKLAPVLFWIHGGSYVNGGGNESRLNGEFDVARSMSDGGEPIIVVTINYRLQTLGFLGSSKLRDHLTGSTGNWGFLDQRAALDYVQNHIEAFGGDPTRVFLVGESAGAGSVTCHTVSKKSWGRWHAAGMESGAYSTWVAKPLADAEDAFDQIVKGTNCDKSSDVIACLRKVPGEELVKVGEQVQVPLFTNSIAWSPVIDGVELTDYPWKLAQANQVVSTPLIVGSVRDEGASFTPSNIPKNITVQEEQDILTTTMNLTSAQAAQALQLYPVSAYNDTPCCSAAWWSLSRIVGDAIMGCPAISAAQWLSGSRDVYSYIFTHVPFSNPPQSNEFVFHSAEIPYVFHVNSLLDVQEGGIQAADTISTYWIAMARNANPNHPSLPTWSPFSNQTQPTNFLNSTAQQYLDVKKPQCVFQQKLRESRSGQWMH